MLNRTERLVFALVVGLFAGGVCAMAIQDARLALIAAAGSAVVTFLVLLVLGLFHRPNAPSADQE